TAACNAVHAVSPGLCSRLLPAHDRVEGDVVPLTQEFMSQMLGGTRTTGTEIARELQSANLIRYTRGRLAILDRKGWEDIACECYDALRRLELQNTPRPVTKSQP